MNAPARQLPLRGKVILASISLVASLAIAELAARITRAGAFPYLNIYVNNPRYGVVLEPHARTHIRSRHGRVTEIKTNALGFRGPEWSLRADRPRVLLLGDSQMLGYGVGEQQAIAARLSELAGVDVINAAVPSWGPFEYA